MRDAVVTVTAEDKIAAAKTAVQRRFDAITREKYQAQREAAAAAAAHAEARAEIATLQAENAELQAGLRRAFAVIDQLKAQIARTGKKEPHCLTNTR